MIVIDVICGTCCCIRCLISDVVMYDGTIYALPTTTRSYAFVGESVVRVVSVCRISVHA